MLATELLPFNKPRKSRTMRKAKHTFSRNVEASLWNERLSNCDLELSHRNEPGGWFTFDRRSGESIPTSEDNLVTSPRRLLTYLIGGIPTSGYAVLHHLQFNALILSSFVIN